jgi:hypothetical protein
VTVERLPRMLVGLAAVEVDGRCAGRLLSSLLSIAPPPSESWR